MRDTMDYINSSYTNFLVIVKIEMTALGKKDLSLIKNQYKHFWLNWALINMCHLGK